MRTCEPDEPKDLIVNYPKSYQVLPRYSEAIRSQDRGPFNLRGLAPCLVNPPPSLTDWLTYCRLFDFKREQTKPRLDMGKSPEGDCVVLYRSLSFSLSLSGSVLFPSLSGSILRVVAFSIDQDERSRPAGKSL